MLQGEEELLSLMAFARGVREWIKTGPSRTANWLGGSQRLNTFGSHCNWELLVPVVIAGF